MTDVGIVIVTYNSEAEIAECLDAAVSTGAHVVVVDNASSDQTTNVVRRREVKLIANLENRGFAAAVNKGIAELDTAYVLLLNPDAVLVRGLDLLCRACDLPGSAGAGGCLLDEKGQPQAGFMVRDLPTPLVLILEALLLNRVWPNNQVNRRYRHLGLDPARQCVVGQPAGAFLMIRRKVWQELGGMDESFYPLWFEDVDLCARIRGRGYSLYYVPGAVAKHTGGHSIQRLSLEMRRYYWYRSLLRYSHKHFRPVAHRSVCAAVALGSVLRGVVESVQRRSFKPLATYAMVMRLAGRSMWSGFGP